MIMRISFSTLLVATAASSPSLSILAFSSRATTGHRTFRSRRAVILQAAEDAAPDDIVAKAREKAGAPKEEEPPSLFDKELLLDMSEALTKLERRVQEGPEALSMLEVDQLDGELRRIIDEMKVNQDKKPPRPARSDGKGAPSQQQASILHADPDAIASLQIKRDENAVVDASLDEGPSYDGHGGMGQPRGTVNTYIIPGMEEMSSDEYRLALQQSLIDRQARRKASGVTGNQQSSNYLEGL